MMERHVDNAKLDASMAIIIVLSCLCHIGLAWWQGILTFLPSSVACPGACHYCVIFICYAACNCILYYTRNDDEQHASECYGWGLACATSAFFTEVFLSLWWSYNLYVAPYSCHIDRDIRSTIFVRTLGMTTAGGIICYKFWRLLIYSEPGEWRDEEEAFLLLLEPTDAAYAATDGG